MSFENFPKDPDNIGWVMGWGVYRMVPWKLHGVYLTEEEARKAHTDAGPEFQMKHGSHKVGTDDFISFTSERSK